MVDTSEGSQAQTAETNTSRAIVKYEVPPLSVQITDNDQKPSQEFIANQPDIVQTIDDSNAVRIWHEKQGPAGGKDDWEGWSYEFPDDQPTTKNEQDLKAQKSLLAVTSKYGAPEDQVDTFLGSLTDEEKALVLQGADLETALAEYHAFAPAVEAASEFAANPAKAAEKDDKFKKYLLISLFILGDITLFGGYNTRNYLSTIAESMLFKYLSPEKDDLVADAKDQGVPVEKYESELLQNLVKNTPIEGMRRALEQADSETVVGFLKVLKPDQRAALLAGQNFGTSSNPLLFSADEIKLLITDKLTPEQLQQLQPQDAPPTSSVTT